VKTVLAVLGLIAVLVSLAACGSSAPRGPNGLIAFDAFPRSSAAWQLFTMRSSGADIHQLTTRPPGPAYSADWNRSPSFSADGKRIAFFRQHLLALGGDPFPALWTMHADGTGPRQVVSPVLGHDR